MVRKVISCTQYTASTRDYKIFAFFINYSLNLSERVLMTFQKILNVVICRISAGTPNSYLSFMMHQL